MTQKVLKVGSSAAVTIPKQTLEELGLKIGDRVYVETSRDRTVRIKPMKTRRVSARGERIARLTFDFIERYRADLEALARK